MSQEFISSLQLSQTWFLVSDSILQECIFLISIENQLKPKPFTQVPHHLGKHKSQGFTILNTETGLKARFLLPKVQPADQKKKKCRFHGLNQGHAINNPFGWSKWPSLGQTPSIYCRNLGGLGAWQLSTARKQFSTESSEDTGDCVQCLFYWTADCTTESHFLLPVTHHTDASEHDPPAAGLS